MTVHENRDDASRSGRDRTVEGAARKVRQPAELHDKTEATNAAKEEAATIEFEAHVELERKKHYRGHPTTA